MRKRLREKIERKAIKEEMIKIKKKRKQKRKAGNDM